MRIRRARGAAIFGLAHLLGIQLQPRIRNWKNLHFFRPDPQVRYDHIDLLFTKQVDWGLIETMLPEMLRVAISIGAGRIRPSTILRRLATYSRKNKLYFAFSEFGRVHWHVFSLDCAIQARCRIQNAFEARSLIQNEQIREISQTELPCRGPIR